MYSKCTNMNDKKRTTWCIPVPETLDAALEQAVKRDTHANKSEFVRDCVRRRLEELGFKATPFEVPA